jgi:hypothetical protein
LDAGGGQHLTGFSLGIGCIDRPRQFAMLYVNGNVAAV